MINKRFKPFVVASTLILALSASNVFAVSIGDKAPDFNIPRLETNGMISLKHYRGKVVYIDFWASWCGPCRNSLPALNRVHTEFREKGFEVIAINLDEEREDAMAFLKEFPVVYPTAIDTSSKVPEAYGLVGMPTAYLVDRQGIVQLVHEGFKKSDIEQLREKIHRLLSQK
jgi:thiol-disulfide isomerase/thioredoxin